ncbi:putative DMT superfamily transporter inner membrane protein [compost metagenome]
MVRFGVAALIMLLLTHLFQGNRLPEGREWRYLLVYGSLNITVYLGCYVIAMQRVTAGIGALAVATNPVFISFLSIFFLKKKLTINIILSILICSAGVICAAWPMFNSAKVSIDGLLLLLFSMVSYSVGAIYFSSRDWNGLHLFTINGWQTLIGGALLLPMALYQYNSSMNHSDIRFWGAIIWLAVPVSVAAVQLWLWLLKKNAVKAGFWLFLCPVFGFAIATIIMHDSITTYTIVGILLVLAGLMVSQKKNKA